MKHKCECPFKGNAPSYMEDFYSEEEKIGMNHKPNECKCTNDLKQYIRNGKKIWLCSCCCLFGDKEVKE